MVTLTPARHGSPSTPRRRMRLSSPRTAAAGWALAIVALLAAMALAAPSAHAQAPEGATAPARTATAPAADAAPQKGAKDAEDATDAPAPVDPESLPIPEGSAAPTAMTGDGAGTLLRLLVGLVVVVGLIAAVWYVMKRVQRSRFPAMEQRAGALIEVISTTPLGPNRSLHLIRVGDELVLVGAAEGGITPITRLAADEAAALVDLAPPAPRFGAPPAGPGGPPSDDRARAVATANVGSLVERLRALTTRR